jgi:hypothetical protein
VPSTVSAYYVGVKKSIVETVSELTLDKSRPPEVSIRLETFYRSRHRQELRKYTDLELILSDTWSRTRKTSSRPSANHRARGNCRSKTHGRMAHPAGIPANWRVRYALATLPGSQAITPRAQMWKASGYEDPCARTSTAAIAAAARARAPGTCPPPLATLPSWTSTPVGVRSLGLTTAHHQRDVQRDAA